MIGYFKIDSTRVRHERYKSGTVIDVSSRGLLLIEFDELRCGQNCLYCDVDELEYDWVDKPMPTKKARRRRKTDWAVSVYENSYENLILLL